jgi:glycosyltransferase involved in cell wall biosynthesis
MISVVVPTRHGAGDFVECITSLRKQKIKPLEIIAVFDSKDDGNIEFARKNKVKVLLDPSHTIGGAYNRGAGSARGDIIAFIDDDCTAPSDWTERIIREFDDATDVLGGEDLLPPRSSHFQKAAYQIDDSRTLKKPIYGKSAKNRLRAANIAYRKKVFDGESFNPKLKGLQEPEFHERLFEKGFKMKFSPNFFVYHKRRNSLREIFSQIHRNGKAKIALIKLHPSMTALMDIIPIAYAIMSIVLAYQSFATGIWYTFFAWLALTAAYVLLKPLVYLARTRRFECYPNLLAIVFVREVAYATGIIVGVPKLFRN